MFDLSISEIAIIAIIAIVVIGPKELPRALSAAGKWMGKARSVMANFRTGFDTMVREAELQEMEKKWASENDRIMLEHPDTGVEAQGDKGDDGPQMQPLSAPPGQEDGSDEARSNTDQPDLPLDQTEKS